MKLLSFRPVAAAAFLLLGACTFAQQPPPAPPLAGPAPLAQPPLGPPPPMAAIDAPQQTLTGRVQRWLLNPNGEVDGFLLADGTQVSFPPHLSADVLQTLRAGDHVQVSGWRAPNVPVVHALTLTATASGRSVTDQAPGIGRTPPPPRDPSALTAMSANGRVARLLYTDRGDANGALLDNGTIVRFPPHIGAAIAPQVQPGSTVYAKGWGTRGTYGTAFEATAIGNSASDMRQLYAGPVDAPPPRGGPRGGRGIRPLPPAGAGALPPPPAS